MGFRLFQMLQIFNPDVRHVVQTEIDEPCDEGEDDETEDAAEFLNRQLRRIRRGETVERLKIRR
jgi:hypothetical protein